jgi:hypothetical protein
MEKPSRTSWKAEHGSRGPRSDPEDERGERTLSAPRIHGELLKLGIEVSQVTVAKYMVRHRKPPSQNWRTFLDNHLEGLVSIDFFVVPTLRFQVLFVFVILAHQRRRVLHFNVTEHPTAEWTAKQLLQAFPWDTAPRYLLRDRDSTAKLSASKRRACKSRKYSRLQDRLGRILMSSA